MIRDIIPKRFNPDNFKSQNIVKVEPPNSSRMYCGKCGGNITPERFSIMRCWKRHDLEKVGIYEFIQKEYETFEGWRLYHGEWVQ